MTLLSLQDARALHDSIYKAVLDVPDGADADADADDTARQLTALMNKAHEPSQPDLIVTLADLRNGLRQHRLTVTHVEGQLSRLCSDTTRLQCLTTCVSGIHTTFHVVLDAIFDPTHLFAQAVQDQGAAYCTFDDQRIDALRMAQEAMALIGCPLLTAMAVMYHFQRHHHHHHHRGNVTAALLDFFTADKEALDAVSMLLDTYPH